MSVIIKQIVDMKSSVDEEFFTPSTTITMILDPENLQDMVASKGKEFTAQQFFEDFLQARDFYNRNRVK